MSSSFLSIPSHSDFSIHNLPYGIFSTHADPRPRLGVAIGDKVLDLRACHQHGLFPGAILSQSSCLEEATLNSFMALGKPAWAEARATLTRLLSSGEATLRDSSSLQQACLLRQADVQMHLPAAIGDYTDFYCSREHATNCGTMLRGPENPLMPNWLHLPVGYHGRASSIIPSGTAVRRPRGQTRRAAAQDPTFGPCMELDFELEMGCFIGPGNELGRPISVEEAEQHIFGYVLVNDWSARDIQKWEMLPLGPFNSKNWATSISPWVVTAQALEPFRVAAPPQDPCPLPYLRSSQRWNYDVQLEVDIVPEGAGQATTVTRSTLSLLYWTLPQIIAHHTAGGCNLRPGDLLATGTLSGKGPGAQGCLLELTWNGTKPLQLAGPGGGQRAFLEDGDTVVMRGWCQGEGYRVGFGECRSMVLPALGA